jgi:hypothetical protein
MMEKIKENGSLIGVIVFVLVIVGFIFTSESNVKKSEVSKKAEEAPVVVQNEATPNTFTGSFKVWGKDTSLFEYSFSLPKEVKAVAEDGGTFIVANIEEKPFAKVYFSDQRVNPKTPTEYLNKIIVPQVKEFSLAGTVPFGDFSWQKGESVTMEWHVAPVLDGKFLAFVESYKKDSSEVAKLLASMKVAMGNSPVSAVSAETKKDVMEKQTLQMEVNAVEGASAN